MNYNISEILSLNDKEALNSLEDILESLKNEYSSIVDCNKFNDQIILKLRIVLNNLSIKNDTISKSNLRKYINAIIIDCIREYSKDNENLCELLNNFIYNKLNFSNEYVKNVSEFSKFSKFLRNIESEFTFDLALDLLNNNIKLSKFIEEVVNTNFKSIMVNNINAVTESFVLKTLIEAYCAINDIYVDDTDKSKEFYIDSVREYLDEIAKFSVLNPSEEIELAKQVKNGDEKAKKKLIESNLRLVVGVAKRYASKDVDMLDLIQEGNIGLMKAAEKYDLSKECKFSTYATWWIKQAVSRYVQTSSRLIKLPVHVYQEYSKMEKERKDIINELGYDPKDSELAERLNTSVDRIRRLKTTKVPITSLYENIGEDSETKLIDMIEDKESVSPEEEALDSAQRDEIKEVLKKLSPREQYVISERFGFNGEVKKLTEIGKEIGVTRERVRQIEKFALRRLRGILKSRMVVYAKKK